MRATASLLAVTTAVGMCGPLQTAHAGVSGTAWLAGLGVCGQIAPPPALPTTNQGAPVADAPSLLRQARVALSAGDVRQAQQWIAQAKGLRHNYAPNDDSPDKVEALLRLHQQFVVGPAPGVDERQFQHQYAQHLMDQAVALMAYGELDRAEQLVGRAGQLGAAFGQFERTPDQMLQQIAAARQAPARGALPTGGPPSLRQTKEEVSRLLAQAHAAMDRGDLVSAEGLAEQARGLQVPESAFLPGEARPWQVLAQIAQAKTQRPAMTGPAAPARGVPGEIALAGGQFPATGAGAVQPGVYNPATDRTRVAPAQAQSPEGANEFSPLRDPSIPSPTPAAPEAAGTPPGELGLNDVPPGYVMTEGERLYRLGLQALQQRDRDTALRHFKDAWKHQAEMDPQLRGKLRDKLSYLQSSSPALVPEDQAPTPLETLDNQQRIALQEMQVRVSTELEAARRQSAEDPKGSLNRLQRLKSDVEASQLSPATLRNLLNLIDKDIASAERYIEQNRGVIELRERNNEVKQEIAADREHLAETQEQVARLVDQFNKLLDEQRFQEAEVVARQARDIAPDLPVVQNLIWQSRFARQLAFNMGLKEKKEAGVLAAFNEVESASAYPFENDNPIVFGPQWEQTTAARRALMARENRARSEQELMIERNLKTKVEVRFNNTPLSEVLETLGTLANVPVHIDPQSLRMEAIGSDEPVTINISQPVMLKSALNLILEPLGLGYVIENEVLKITTADAKHSTVETRVYPVADLVIPIPNFVPGYDVGLPAAIREAHQALGYGGGGALNRPLPYMLSANQQGGDGPNGGSVLAQMSRAGLIPNSTRPTTPSGMGPGGAGGAAMADFDTLIELITSTIAPETWDEVGGPGAIEPFPTNLSLVVSQQQEVHEQIVALLDQLRRLQDLQITIEVRFITLTDNFFERIGIDFDVNIDDNSRLGNGNPGTLYPDDTGPSVVYGLDNFGAPTPTLDLMFTQGSFASTAPQFGGFDAMTAANFGFAILSDIEVFFLIQASQGDQRSNVLQAPKVTLYNGQSASVSDTSQRPFVTSIIPIVGDFAAAHMPVITVLNEGTSLSVQGVISPDRRFVRLTLVPFFSQIGQVDTFTFNGRTTSNTGTAIVDDQGAPTGQANNAQATTEGTTVQLPTFSFTTVSTTVNVPDGGTVLLGGIKRLREARSERGVPMLSKLPYVSRLFKNVGIGRDTQSLMLMVTPRIIIQEEQENNLGIAPQEEP